MLLFVIRLSTCVALTSLQRGDVIATWRRQRTLRFLNVVDFPNARVMHVG